MNFSSEYQSEIIIDFNNKDTSTKSTTNDYDSSDFEPSFVPSYRLLYYILNIYILPF